MTLNAWSGLPDPEAPKNLREGEPYNDPKFEELARTYGIWGTAQSALCAQFWQAARRAPVVPSDEAVRDVMHLIDDWSEKDFVAASSRLDHWSEHDPSAPVQMLEKLDREAYAARLAIEQKLRDLIAAAPQPPDGLMSEKRTSKPEAAPVQMPEPAANAEGGMVVWNRRLGNPPIESNLYTEQQVRQLLEDQLAELIRKEDDLLHAAIVSRPTEFGGIGFDEKEQPK